MAQHDYSIANQSGAAFRSDLNNALSAIVTNNSGATTPTTTYAFQMWADTTAGVMKLRNAANSAWITLYQLDGEWSSIAFENGSAAAPSIYFKDSGTDTGLYSPGTDQVAISTGGTGRLFVNSSGSVGIGTSSPSTNTEINAALDTGAGLALNEGQLSIGREANSGGAVRIGYDTTNNFGFISSGRVGVSWDKLILNAGGGNVGIGTTSPGALLTLAASVPELRFVDSDNSFYGTITAPGGDIYIDADKGNGAGGSIIRFAVDDSERARIDSSGRLLVGTSTSVQVYQGATAFNSETQVAGSSASLTIARSIGSGNLFLARNQTVTSGSPLGVVSFNGGDGTNLIQAAQISAEVDGTPGTNDMPGRLVFSTTADGASSPTERMKIDSTGKVFAVGVYNATTGAAANVAVDSAGHIQRSTSSIKYKTDVETLEDAYADALLQCRPVWYRSTCSSDNPDWGWWGFIAEEVAAIDPRLVHWKTVEVTYDEKGAAVQTPCEPEPEGVQYERFVPHLLNLIKRQQQAIETLEAKVSVLESKP